VTKQHIFQLRTKLNLWKTKLLKQRKRSGQYLAELKRESQIPNAYN